MFKDSQASLKIGEDLSLNEALDLHRRLAKAIDEYNHQKVAEFFSNEESEETAELPPASLDTQYKIPAIPTKFTIQETGYYYITQGGKNLIEFLEEGDVVDIKPNQRNEIQILKRMV